MGKVFNAYPQSAKRESAKRMPIRAGVSRRGAEKVRAACGSSQELGVSTQES